MIEQELREVLYRERKKQHKTLKEVGADTGTMPHLVGYYEKGVHIPSLWKAEDLLAALGYKLAIVPIK